MANRQLCVVIDFSIMPAKPKPARVDEFIEKNVQLDWSKVRGLQLNNVTSHVYIKMDSKESAEELAEQHNLLHAMDYKGVTYNIPFFIADGGTDVKLHDLPFDMPNHLIAEQMTQYGEVMSVKDDCWRNLFRQVPNGVRIVRIRISRPIPSYLSISGELTLATHKNQVPTCRHCNRRVHYTMKCSEYAKSLQREVNKLPPVDHATTGDQPVDPITSRDISPDGQQNSTRDETPPPLLTPAYIFSPTTTAAAAVAVDIDDADDAPPVLYPAAAAVFSEERSAQLVKETTESSGAKGSGRNSRETSAENVSKVPPNQRTRSQNSESGSGFKRPGSPKSADSKRPSRSKNRN